MCCCDCCFRLIMVKSINLDFLFYLLSNLNQQEVPANVDLVFGQIL